MSRTSHGNRPKKPTPPHKAVISHLRQMRANLSTAVRVWDVRATVTEVVQEIPREAAPLPVGLLMVDQDGKVSQPGVPYQWIERVYGTRPRRADEYPQADSHNWDELRKLAIHTRDMADRLAAYAQQQGLAARRAAHPANQPTDTPTN